MNGASFLIYLFLFFLFIVELSQSCFSLFRVFVKLFYEFASSSSHDRKNVLIYGSGEMGILVKRLIEGDPKNLYRLKGFIDDDKKIQGKNLDGYPVYSRQVLKGFY